MNAKWRWYCNCKKIGEIESQVYLSPKMVAINCLTLEIGGIGRTLMLSGDLERHWRCDLFYSQCGDMFTSSQIIFSEDNFNRLGFHPSSVAPLLEVVRKITWHYQVRNHGVLMDDVSPQ